MTYQPLRLDTTAWHNVVGQVIEAVGHNGFPEMLMQAIAEIVPYDSSLIVEFQKDSAPIVLYDHIVSSERELFENVWLKGGYLFGPYYNAFLQDIPDGFYSLKQVARDTFTKSEYYKMYFRHVGQSDMCSYVAWRSPSQCISLCIARAHFNDRFSSQELNNLRKIERVVRSAMLKHWQKASRGKKASTFHSQLLNRASVFGQYLLSDREYEVLHYVLRGQSTKSIANKIGVTPDTVRAHQKHTYRKFGVRSQGELFSLFFTHLAVNDPT